MMSDGTNLSIELAEHVARYECPCCKLLSETVHGFLYDETGVTTVYMAGFAHGHPERRANFVLSVGGWGEGTGPEDRKAIAMQVLAHDDRVELLFPRAETSPWQHTEMLGRMVEPDAIPEHERIVYRRVAMAAVDKDSRLATYLANG